MTPELLEVVLDRLDRIETSVDEIKDRIMDRLACVETSIAVIKNKQDTNIRQCKEKHSWGKRVWVPTLIAIMSGASMLIVQWIVGKLA